MYDMNTKIQVFILHLLAFTVAFCGFTYELLYSELYRTVYGGTVTQYSLTIGLFFASLGLGSYFSRYLDDDKQSNFLRSQVYISLIAPVGFLFVLFVGFSSMFPFSGVVEQAFSRIPILLIGLLSGFELPILFSMVDEDKLLSQEGRSGFIHRFENSVGRLVSFVVGLFFHTGDSEEYDTYSSVLMMDYIGSLIGALFYAFYLYPVIGLGASVFVLALLNALAALLFVFMFDDRFTSLSSYDSISITGNTYIVFLCLLIFTANLGVAFNHQLVNSKISEYQTVEKIEQEYVSDDVVNIDVVNQTTTKYQQITHYERKWTGDSESRRIPEGGESCLRLDTAIQMCESWVKPYHKGLVDVPMSMYNKTSDLEVLVIGGGDWIPINYLREYGSNIDLVDLDKEFMDMSKNYSLLQRFHENSYNYENLTVYNQDGFSYIRNTDKNYDLVILDIPGAVSDDLIHLYTEEFYTNINNRLTEQGKVVTWTYDESTYSQHNAIYSNTISEAGFNYMYEYWQYGQVVDNSEKVKIENFYILSSSDTSPNVTPNHTDIERNVNISWTTIPEYRGVEPNTRFKPNYGIIIETDNQNR